MAQVRRWAKEGMSMKQIARQLGRDPKTVRDRPLIARGVDGARVDPPHSDHPLGGLAMNHFAMSERGSTHCPLGFMSIMVLRRKSPLVGQWDVQRCHRAT